MAIPNLTLAKLQPNSNQTPYLDMLNLTLTEPRGVILGQEQFPSNFNA